MPRRHIVKAVNRRGGLVSGVTFEIAFDGTAVARIENSAGTYTVANIPDDVSRVTVRAFDATHDETETFLADDDSYYFQFTNAPVAGLDLRGLADTYSIIRPKFINRVAWLLIVSGVGMASGPIWQPYLNAFLGVTLPDLNLHDSHLPTGLIGIGVLLAVAANYRSFLK